MTNSLAFSYINSIPNPTAPYGQLPPHEYFDCLPTFLNMPDTSPFSAETGIYNLMMSQVRSPPKATAFPTNETVHYSVTLQKTLTAPISAVLAANPTLVQPLEGFEKLFQDSWIFIGGEEAQRVTPQTLTALALKSETRPVGRIQKVLRSAEGMMERLSGITVHGH